MYIKFHIIILFHVKFLPNLKVWVLNLAPIVMLFPTKHKQNITHALENYIPEKNAKT